MIQSSSHIHWWIIPKYLGKSPYFICLPLPGSIPIMVLDAENANREKRNEHIPSDRTISETQCWALGGAQLKKKLMAQHGKSGRLFVVKYK